MANLATPTDVLRLEIQTQIAESRVLMSPLLRRVQKLSAYQDAVKWPANVSVNASSFRASTAVANAATSDIVRGAALPMGGNAATETITIMKTDITQAVNTAEGALRNLFAYQVKTHLEKIMKSISAGMYLGDGALYGDMVGLNALTYAPAAALPTYAGISGVTYPAWSAYANTVATGTRALSDDLMFQMEEGMAYKGSNYNAIYTSPGVVSKYKKLFATNRNLTVQTPAVADLGFTSVEFAGRPVFMDIDCPQGTMYFVDESQMALHTYVFGEQEAPSGINVQVAELPISNTLAVSYEVSVIPQLQIMHPRHVGVLSGLAV